LELPCRARPLDALPPDTAAASAAAASAAAAFSSLSDFDALPNLTLRVGRAPLSVFTAVFSGDDRLPGPRTGGRAPLWKCVSIDACTVGDVQRHVPSAVRARSACRDKPRLPWS